MPMPNRTHGPIAVGQPTAPPAARPAAGPPPDGSAAPSHAALRAPLYLRIGWLTLIVAWLLMAWDTMAPYPLAGFCTTVVAFCLPGWALLRWFWGSGLTQRGNAGHWIVGAALGLTITSFVATVEGYLIGRVSGWSVVALDAASLVVMALSANRPPRPPRTMIRPWTSAELTVLWAALFIVTLFVMRPLSQTGAESLYGTAYPRLIVERLYGHASMAANGLLGLPPPYLHMASETLHVPMTGYMVPLVGQLWFDPVGNPAGWMTLWTLLLALLFAAFLVAVFRRMTQSVIGMAGMATLGFLCYGYHVFAPDLAGPVPDRGSGMSHGLYRMLLVEPTVMLAILALLTGGLLLYRTKRLASKRAGLALGAMLGVTVGIDAFWGMIAGIAMLIAFVAELRAVRRGWSIVAGRWFYAYLGFGLVAVVLTISKMLEGLPLPNIGVDVSMESIARVPSVALVEFGALVVFGVAGVVLRRRAGHRGTPFVTGLFAVFALLIMAAVHTPTDPTYGLEHGGRLLLLTCLAGSAGVFMVDWRRGARLRLTAAVTLAVLTLVALPTFVGDYVTSARTGRHDRTFYLSDTDRRATAWIRIALEPDRVVQAHPDYLNYLVTGAQPPPALSIVPIFAGRPTHVGAWHMPYHPFDAQRRWNHARRQLTALFTGSQPREIARMARIMQIEYIYVGPLERALYPRLEHHLRSDIQFFERVYYDRENPSGVRIYRVR